MTNQEIQKELDQIAANLKAIKEETVIECGAPEIKRTFTYRKSPAIKSSDIASL